MLTFNMVAISLAWIYTTGIHGTMPLAFLPSLILCVLIFEPKHSIKIISIHLIGLLITGVLGFKLHYLSSGYDSLEQEYLDKVSYAFTTVLAIGVMIMMLYKRYDEERSNLQKINNQLLKSQEELKEANSQLEEFTSIVSHDLKTPLRGIHHYTQFLKEDFENELPEEAEEMIEGINKLSKKMDGLVGDVLSYSKAQRVELEIKTFNLADPINVVKADIKDQPDINIDIEISVMPMVKADIISLNKAFYNFVTNAHKYNDSENKKIEFKFDSKTNQLLISDNGIGIAEKDFDQVFAFFKRIHGKEEYGGGTGAGMAIVKRILQRLGITIEIESEVGKGTTFKLDLSKVLV